MGDGGGGDDGGEDGGIGDGGTGDGGSDDDGGGGNGNNPEVAGGARDRGAGAEATAAENQDQGRQPPQNRRPDQQAPEGIGILPPDEGADRDDYTVTAADRLLDSGYGDHAHTNDGTHLNGGY